MNNVRPARPVRPASKGIEKFGKACLKLGDKTEPPMRKGLPVNADTVTEADSLCVNSEGKIVLNVRDTRKCRTIVLEATYWNDNLSIDFLGFVLPTKEVIELIKKGMEKKAIDGVSRKIWEGNGAKRRTLLVTNEGTTRVFTSQEVSELAEA